MTKKTFSNVHFLPKGDIEANWDKAVGFIPMKKEIIEYLPDENHTATRFKVGDGITTVQDLPFSGVNEAEIKAYIDSKIQNNTTATPVDFNIENGIGEKSIQQSIDTVEMEKGFDFNVKNPKALALFSALSDDDERKKVVLANIGNINEELSVGEYSQSFGGSSAAFGKRATASGQTTLAISVYSHTEGDNSVTLGDAAHAEGYKTTAFGNAAHAEGNDTAASGNSSHSEGYSTSAEGENSHAEGALSKATGDLAHAEGHNTLAEGYAAHAEGYETEATSGNAHAEGNNTHATATAAHAEGISTTASNDGAHAEGHETTASGYGAHAEGYNTEATESFAHAEGHTTKAYANMAHAEGENTEASGIDSHAEGKETLASGFAAHAQGFLTKAKGNQAFAGGYNTIAEHEDQFVIGRFNKNSKTNLFEIGYGTEAGRKNIFEVSKDGTAILEAAKIHTDEEFAATGILRQDNKVTLNPENGILVNKETFYSGGSVYSSVTINSVNITRYTDGVAAQGDASTAVYAYPQESGTIATREWATAQLPKMVTAEVVDSSSEWQTSSENIDIELGAYYVDSAVICDEILNVRVTSDAGTGTSYENLKYAPEVHANNRYLSTGYLRVYSDEKCNLRVVITYK